MTGTAKSDEILTEIGGPIDLIRGSVSLHGLDLEPDEISKLLRRSATVSRRRGDATPMGRTWDRGSWKYEIRGEAPLSIDEVARGLIADLPNDPALWISIRERYRVSVGFTLHIVGPRGFSFSPETLVGLSVFGVEIGFSIYSHPNGSLFERGVRVGDSLVR